METIFTGLPVVSIPYMPAAGGNTSDLYQWQTGEENSDWLPQFAAYNIPGVDTAVAVLWARAGIAENSAAIAGKGFSMVIPRGRPPPALSAPWLLAFLQI